MATSRAPCQSCSLPFYTDENDLCPYCGQVVADGSGVGDAPSVRSRATCDTCGLAYYDEEGECPYCAAAAERAASAETASDAGEMAGDTEAGGGTTTTAPARPRVTCDTCGLAYYEDENDACPYCAKATPSTAAASAEGATEEPASEPEPEAGGDDADSVSTEESAESSSLLGSLLRPLRKLFGG